MMNDNTEGSNATQVICPAAKDLVIRPLILAVGLIAFGIWCATDQQEYVAFDTDMNSWLSWAMNFYGQFIFTALGLIPLYFAFRAYRRRLIADADGVGFEGKEKIAWSSVTGLDAGELKSKQILHLLHGQGRRYTLDGFNLQNFAALVAFVEQRVPQAAAAPPAQSDPDPPAEADAAPADDEQEPDDS